VSRGGPATSESSGEASGDARVTVVDVAVGGTGGSGGAAVSHAFGSNTGASPVDVTSFSRGGVGLVVAGGSATAAASGSSSGGGDVTARAIQMGGGGVWSYQPDPVHAAQSHLANAVSGWTSGLLTLIQEAIGGAPRQGDGGDASSALVATNPGGGAVALVSQATGGRGGQDGTGGAALASAIADADGATDVAVTARATGGKGGLDGAGAALGTVRGTSSGGGSVSVTGEVIGGDGGDAEYAPATAGDGASVDVEDAIEGLTSGALALTQIARGGDGGYSRGGAGGDGGSARSALTRDASVASLAVTVEAAGGHGGSAETTGGDGGGADARATARNDAGNVIVEGTARAGSGGGAQDGIAGRGADATLDLFAESSGDGHRVVIGDAANRSLGSYGGNGGYAATGGAAGAARSTSTGIAHGASEVTVFDRAVGGVAGSSTLVPSRGGDAFSTATGSTPSAASVSVTSLAIAGGGPLFPFGSDVLAHAGDADAHATAQGGGTAEAIATAQSSNYGRLADYSTMGHAHALAEAAAADALARAEIEAAAPDLGLSRVTMSASASGSGSLRAETDAVVGASSLPSLATGAASLAVIAPGAATVDAALAGNEYARDHLDLGGAPHALALATLGGDKSGARTNGPATVATTLSLTLSPKEFANSATGIHFALALLDPHVTGDGFDSIRFHVSIEGEEVLSKTFTDLALAESFFDDEVLDLGNVIPTVRPPSFPGYPPYTLPIDVEIGLDLELGGGDTGFFATLLLARATPVPEAGTLSMLGIGLAILARRRRNA
jgi:hypothetical protein